MSYTNIPIVVVLWQNTNYSGRRCPILTNTDNMNHYALNNDVDSIRIHPGPNYDNKMMYRVGFFEEIDYQGGLLVLSQGAYPSLVRPYGFNDAISSIRFYPPLNTYGVNPYPISAPTISPIPLVVELFDGTYYRGRRLNVVENIPNTHSYATFGDTVSSVRVHQGPNYTAGNSARFFRDVNYLGGYIDLPVGDYPDIGISHGFNDVVSSVKIR